MIDLTHACQVIRANIEVRDRGMSRAEIIEHHCRQGGIREEIAAQAITSLLAMGEILDDGGRFIVPRLIQVDDDREASEGLSLIAKCGIMVMAFGVFMVIFGVLAAVAAGFVAAFSR